jgi:RNA polymerase sigma factor (sigma-70 family)
MRDGRELLADYVKNGSETAFRDLVSQYINFVYSTALRLVGGDTLLAQDVAQTVFINLARKAASLSSQVSLGGWLHEHTFHVATKAARSEGRRQAREQEAMERRMLEDNPGQSLAQVRPILDEAIRKLDKEDRDSILLRFFEQRDFRSVGAVLGTSEDAARMRVNRALEKLSLLLKRQGVTLSAAALATGLATEAVTAAPAGLAVTAAGAALTGAAGGTAFTALKLLGMTKFKLGVVSAVAVAMAAPLIVQHEAAARLREENQSLQQQQTRLTQLAADNERLSNLLAQTTQILPEQQNLELLRLRGEVGLLRQQARELAQLQQENRQLRARAVQQAAAGSSTRELTATDESARGACVNNLRQIDGAMQQYALEHSLSATNIVTAEQISPYLKAWEEVFRCPSGGTYTFGSLTNPPTCSIPGHAIPQQ